MNTLSFFLTVVTATFIIGIIMFTNDDLHRDDLARFERMQVINELIQTKFGASNKP